MNGKNKVLSQIQSVVGDPELVKARRAQIIKAAIRQFSLKGFHETTIKDIAKEAEVSPGLIYQYVADKHDVLFLAIVDVVEQNKREIPKAIASADDPIGKFTAVVDAYTRINHENRHAVTLTYRETKSLPPKYRNVLKAMEVETNELISNVIRRCIDAGLFRHVNVDLVTYHVVVAAQSWATKYWRFRDITTLDEYIRTTIDLLMRGLLVDPDRATVAWLADRPTKRPRHTAAKKPQQPVQVSLSTPE